MIDGQSDDACSAHGGSVRKKTGGEPPASPVPGLSEGGWEHAELFTQHSPPMILVGLEAISKAVGAGNKAILRWIKEENFPARRNTDGIYRADPEAVRRWFSTSCLRDRP